jgi:uncharacterized protein
MGIRIDADSHVGEPAALWREYIEPKYRERAPQVVDQDGIAYLRCEGRVFDELPIAPACVPGGLEDLEKTLHTRWDDVPPGGWDPKARLGVLDAEGLSATVLYPTVGLLFAGILDPAVAAATCDGYNRWVADFCGENPRRLFAAAALPLQDVREMERAKKLGLVAAFVRPTPYNHRRLNDPAYDSFWAAAQDLDLPVAVHGSFPISTIPSVADDRYPIRDLFYTHIICHPLEQQMASMDILCGGVAERFPSVRIAFLESGAGWLLYWLDRLDNHFEKLGRFRPECKLKPSEYFRRQCFVAYEADESTIGALTEAGLLENLIWGSDYPHFDCPSPEAVAELEEHLEHRPPAVLEHLLNTNPERLYRLELP